MSKRCICCGTELADNAIFCPVCGKRQSAAEKAKLGQNETVTVEPQKPKTENDSLQDDQKVNPTHKAYLSLILGIITWITLSTIYIPMITSVVGTVFGVKALKSTKKKTAIAGLVLNGIIIFAVVLALII